MDEEEEILCKIIKCGRLAAAKIGSTESILGMVPAGVSREKHGPLIRLYERFYHEMEEMGL